MTHPSKVKGNRFERELVVDARASGLDSQRAYASNGESLGLHAEVDCLIGGFKIQAKRRKAIAAHLVPSKNVDCVITRPDRGETLVIMRWNDWKKLVESAQDHPQDVANERVT